MVTFDADRLRSTVAPASAANDDGGIGTHTSSQISTWNFRPGSPAPAFDASKSICAPKGTVWPQSVTSVEIACVAGANWRAS